ncbi:MAG: protein kinase domain-containing protein, partial [Byssovorax sp.]
MLALGDEWSERQDRGGFPYHQRQFTREGGKRPLVVAAAWLGKMGRTVAAIRGGAFLRELDPACVAMCGICAGMRGETALGDVIIADRLYSFDEGKLVAVPGKDPELHHDIKTYDLHPLWTMNAASVKREIDLPALQKLRPPSKEAQGRWLLHAQYKHEVEGGPAPDAHAEHESACPNWSEILVEAEEKGLLVLKAGALSLTEAGRELVLNERRRFQKKLPRDPDLRIHVGTVGTGSAVQKDPGLFPRLRRVMRSTIGVEMEGAAVGELAQHFEKRGLVVKAVSDHGDLQKDDSFRKFACRASAEVLLAFLVKYFEPGREEEAQPAPLSPSPSRDLKVQALRDDLEAARVRKQRLVQSGLSTSDVDRDILNLRRAMRAGGQLREGDALGNGRYLLARRIGKGGFAIVWEAIDTSRGERVALKVLHPELAGDPLRLERFFRGAREMAELTHEAVVRVFEQHGEDDGLHYFVMEFAPGGDLRRAVLEKRVSAEDVLGIIDRIADALVAAH